MSKDSGKAEPSMDDILASIRRIIDEDGSKTRKPASASAGKSASDILELTEMVNDDGSVTSLEKQSAAAAGAQSKFIDEDEPPIYADREDRPMPFGAPEPVRPTLAGDPKAPNAPQPAVDRPTQPAPPQAAPRPPVSPPPAPPQAQPMPNQPPRITPTPAMGGPISLTPVNTPPAAPSPAGLVSSQAANAATAAFDRLAQAALQQQQPPSPSPAAPRAPSPTVGGRALEDMVSEMLRPMLQNWLDTNLPGIVERLVQQEIQKMSKR